MRKRIRTIVIPFTGLLLLGGCGQKSEEPGTQADRTASEVPLSTEPGAPVSVRVLFEGQPPQQTRIRMGADPKCAALHTSDVFLRQVITGREGRLKNAFVYVKEGLGRRSFEKPTEPVVIDQRGCMYEPRVFGIQVNQTLVIKNSDPTLHNVNVAPRRNRGFNIAQPVQGMQTERTFSEPEVMVPFKCDVHPWMSSYAGVLAHPFFGLTDEEGMMELKGLPVGEYVIAVWHERLGEMEQTVAVSSDELREVEFRFKPIS